MHVSVTFRKMDSSDALKTYAEEKSKGFVKYLVEPVEIHWFLSIEKIRHIAEATVIAKDLTVKAKQSSQEMYSSIDEVLDKLERQIIRHKEKLKSHKFETDNPLTTMTTIRYPKAEVETGKKTPRVIKAENLFAKPMSVEEAVMQIEVNNKKFVVFTDSSTNSVNVLYRRDDGDFGLIETRTK